MSPPLGKREILSLKICATLGFPSTTSQIRANLGMGKCQGLLSTLPYVSQLYRTFLDKIVQRDLVLGCGLDIGSLTDFINLGVGFGENPEHILRWVQKFHFDDLIPTESKSTFQLMKAIDEFADRMSPCLRKSS